MKTTPGAIGSAPPPGALTETDAVVIGAGPVGLFQVFELGLLDIRAHVVDALPHVGGQPMELYPDKPIYDIPGLPACTGRSLVEGLLQQARPFQPQFHLGQTVQLLERQADHRWLLATSAGTRLLTTTVYIAAGVGAFEPRRLQLEGLAGFEGSQVAYHVGDKARLAHQSVVILGDTEQAIDTALALSESGPGQARSMTLIHRRDSFKAPQEKIDRMRQRCEEQRMRFVAGQITGIERRAERLAALNITRPDASVDHLPVDHLLVLQGLSPRLGPITDWGLAMERKLLQVDTERFETSERGIFAVGDINTYPGKRKLLVCGFHECTLAAFAGASIIHPDQPISLQYTTSSTHLHRLLGVEPQ